MRLFTDAEQEALKDGATALRYRGERLRSNSLYAAYKPESENMAKAYDRHAAMLEEIAKKDAEDENVKLRALVIEAYDGDPPTNGWRQRAEKLDAWPGAS